MSNLLSQGGYGCVYYPGLNCENEKSKPDKKYVTKLQKKNFNSENEHKISMMVKKIKHYEYFFLPVESQCPIDLISYKNKNKDRLKECEIIKNEKKEYVLMKILYSKNKPVTDVLFSEKVNNKELNVCIYEIYVSCLQGIKLLQENNIVHFDLKSDNILFDPIYNDTKIIDFGLSININNLNENNYKEYFYIYAPEYFLWPLEVHVINYFINMYDNNIIDEEYTNNIANKIANSYVENNKALNIFSDEFNNNYKNLCIFQIKQYIQKYKNKKNIITNLIKFNYTWDNYALSIMMLRIFDLIFKTGFSYYSFFINFSQLLMYNIHPNPLKRFSVTETFNNYIKIYYSESSIQERINMLYDINIEAAGFKMFKEENELLDESISNTKYVA